MDMYSSGWCCLCSSETGLSIWHVTYVLLVWQLPQRRDFGVTLQANEKEFSSSAKDHLVDSLRQQAVDSDTVTRHAMALRRSALGAAAWPHLA